MLPFDETNHRPDAFAAQASARWGGTEAYREYEKKNEGRTPMQEQALADGMMGIFAEFGKAKHLRPSSAEAQGLVRRLQSYITEHYYTCTKQILAGLEEAYSAGGEFTGNIDRAGGPGTAQFAAEAIRIYCAKQAEKQQNEPDPSGKPGSTEAPAMVCKVEKGTNLADLLLAYVESCPWDEVKDHIADVIRSWAFTDWETMFVAILDGRIVGMASVAKTDYYPLPDVCPWVSSIFVSEEYRGRRLSGDLLSHANRYLKKKGFARSYIPSAHSGLYERYGYTYLKDIVNYGGGTDHLFVKDF